MLSCWLKGYEMSRRNPWGGGGREITALMSAEGLWEVEKDRAREREREIIVILLAEELWEVENKTLGREREQ